MINSLTCLAFIPTIPTWHLTATDNYDISYRESRHVKPGCR